MTQELPLDIILKIVGLVATSEEIDPRIAFPASHLITKTLLSLALTSKAISAVAIKHLYSRCASIDSATRLGHFSRSLSTNVEISRHVSSLFLCPFHPDAVLDLPTSRDVATVLQSVSKVLRRLVIDMPLRSLYPEEDTDGVRLILQSAFKSLEVVEEFCSARDELFLSTTIRDEDNWQLDVDRVWSEWKKLKRLALYNTMLDADFVQGLRERANSLTHLVLTRSDGLTDDYPDPKVVFGGWKHCLERVLLIDGGEDGRTRYGWANGTDTVDGTRVETDVVEAFWIRLGAEESRDLIENVQMWVRDCALSGRLWNCRGRIPRRRV